MITKIESAIKGHTTATVKAENVEQKVFNMQEALKKHIPTHEKDKMQQDTQMWASDSKIKQLESKVKELEINLLQKVGEQKKEFENMRTPMFDQLQRASRENEALQRELERQQDQTRKMLAQFQKTVSALGP